jgi:hypothetical protein
MRGHSKEGREPVKARRRKTLTLKRRLTTRPDNALQTLHEIQYRKWREFVPTTLSGSIHCACAKRALSGQARTTAQIGVFSTI